MIPETIKEKQTLSFCTAESGPQIELCLSNPDTSLALRNALHGVLYSLRRGFKFRPSKAVEENPGLKASFDALGQGYNERTANTDHQELLSFIQGLKDQDQAYRDANPHDKKYEGLYQPNDFIQPDASMTVLNSLFSLFVKILK